MAAMGALRTGAGLTFLGVPESIYAIEAIKLNEPVVFSLPDEDGKLSFMATADILKRLPGMDAVLIGCGLGISAGTRAVVKAVLEQACCPVVLDADGITLMSEHKDILRGRNHPSVLTPHEGEFVRIFGAIEPDRVTVARQLSVDTGAIVLLKGHRTVITDGNEVYINPTGNPGMAVGGSGDVLAGIITSLLGQHIPVLESAAMGAWLHGSAGDRCASDLGEYGILPTDIINTLPRLLK